MWIFFLWIQQSGLYDSFRWIVDETRAQCLPSVSAVDSSNSLEVGDGWQSSTIHRDCRQVVLQRCWSAADAARAVPVLLHYTSPLISPGHVRIWMMPSDSRAAPTYYQLNTWKPRPLRETKATLINPRWAFLPQELCWIAERTTVPEPADSVDSWTAEPTIPEQ